MDHVSTPVTTIKKVIAKVVTPIKLFARNLGNGQDGPAEMNILVDAFFTSQWQPDKNGDDKKGKWVTSLIDNPYQFGFHRAKPDGTLVFR